MTASLDDRVWRKATADEVLDLLGRENVFWFEYVPEGSLWADLFSAASVGPSAAGQALTEVAPGLHVAFADVGVLRYRRTSVMPGQTRLREVSYDVSPLHEGWRTPTYAESVRLPMEWENKREGTTEPLFATADGLRYRSRVVCTDGIPWNVLEVRPTHGS